MRKGYAHTTSIVLCYEVCKCVQCYSSKKAVTLLFIVKCLLTYINDKCFFYKCI